MGTTILKILGSKWFWLVVIFVVGFGAGFWGRGVYEKWQSQGQLQDTNYIKLSDDFVKTQDSLQIANNKLQIAEKIVSDLLTKNSEGRVEIKWKYAYRDTLIMQQMAGKDYLDLKSRFIFYSLKNPKLNNYGFDSAEVKAMNIFCNEADYWKADRDSLEKRNVLQEKKVKVLNEKVDNLLAQNENCINELHRITSEPRIIQKPDEYPVKFRLAVHGGYYNKLENITSKEGWRKGQGKIEIETGIDLKRIPVRVKINTRWEYELGAGYIIK